MKYTLTILEPVLAELQAHLARSANEEAAYVRVRVVTLEDEIRFLATSIIPVETKHILAQSPSHLSIQSASYVHETKMSALEESAFVFVHSHPNGPTNFSEQDDREEPALFALAHRRNPKPAHLSVVVANDGADLTARAWLPDGSVVPVTLIRIIGSHWRFLAQGDTHVADHFDRQVRAFGSEIQKALGALHIGVVGLGGTGSAVVEQLIRLGVGTLTVVDHDKFDPTNVNRVYGSRLSDQNVPKVEIAKRLADTVGLGTVVRGIDSHLTFKDAAVQLRSCDVIFGCTDDQWGRSILTRIAIFYAIPVVDVGVVIDPDLGGDRIRGIHGRVTILQPGYACLYCRERITPKGVADETTIATDPARAAQLVAEGYIVGANAPAPSVIAFTSATSAAAVAEFLDRLVGFKTAIPKSSEFIHRFEDDAIRRNTRPSQPGCFCSNKDLWAVGDKRLFLGITWRRT